jgi:hypothetical protein
MNEEDKKKYSKLALKVNKYIMIGLACIMTIKCCLVEDGDLLKIGICGISALILIVLFDLAQIKEKLSDK